VLDFCAAPLVALLGVRSVKQWAVLAGCVVVLSGAAYVLIGILNLML
jgi:hypothetical protein